MLILVLLVSSAYCERGNIIAEKDSNKTKPCTSPLMPKFAITFPSTNSASRGVKGFILLSIICLSITGNSVIVALVSRDRRYLTSTNIIVLSQVITDFLMIFTVMTLEAVSILKGVLRVSHIVCVAHVYFLRLTIILTVLNLTVLSLDRYVVTVKGSLSFLQKSTRGKVLVLLFMLWFEAIIITLPWEHFLGDIDICNWKTSLPCIQAFLLSVKGDKLFINRARLALHGIVPFLVIIYCLYRILRVVCFNRRKIRPAVSSDCKETTVKIHSDSVHSIIISPDGVCARS